jgi:serine/threonine-protein kinase
VTDELGQAATLPHRRAAAPAVTAEATPIAEREGPAPTTPPPDAAPAPPRAEADDLIPFGTMLGGRYEVRGHLGSGGMGTVYAARDCLMELPVALKFVRPQLATDPREQSRLWREVRLAQAITHVNVVRTYTLERQGGHLFIVMELLDGVSLADRLREGPLPLDEVVRITRDVLAGLSAAHARNIVHRDVKPQNTRICADGRVVVMDFGIARTEHVDAPTESGAGAVGPHTILAGTPGYIAPEVLTGAPATPASDLYAVGVLVFQMLTGKRPSETRTISMQEDTACGLGFEPGAELTGAPPQFARLLAGLLAREPAERFSSVARVLRALDELEAPAAATETATERASPPASIPAPAAPVPASTARPGRSPRMAVVAAAAVLAIGAVVVGQSLSGSPLPPVPTRATPALAPTSTAAAPPSTAAAAAPAVPAPAPSTAPAPTSASTPASAPAARNRRRRAPPAQPSTKPLPAAPSAVVEPAARTEDPEEMRRKILDLETNPADLETRPSD